jgi:molybdopterin converting factor small subunit
MIIKIKGYLTFRNWLPEQEIKLPDVNLSLLGTLSFLADNLDPDFANNVFDVDKLELKPHVSILLNGVHSTHLLDRMDTTIREGDTLSFFPPIAGG